MVNRKTLTILVISALIAGVGYWFVAMGNSPEDQVKQRLKDLCEACNKKVAESAPRLVIKNESLRRMFADPIEISGDAWVLVGSHSPQELANQITRGRQMFASVRLSYTDLTVTMTGDDKAIASFTAKLMVIGKIAGSGRHDEYRQIAATLSRFDNRWVFNEFKVINVMEK